MTAAAPAPTYDLATEAGDYPPWEGPPRRTVLICTHMRSGSTLLGEALRAAGLGTPLEYFHRGFRPSLQALWNADSLETYLRALYRRRIHPSGVLAVKLFWTDLEDLAHERAPPRYPAAAPHALTLMDADGYRGLFSLVADLFPNPTFVRLRRLDRVRHAVSHLAAAQTGVWRAVDGQGPAARGPAVYDYQRILGLISLAERSHAAWTGFFEAIGEQPYALTYEQLDRDYEGAVLALLRALDAPAVAAPPPRLRLQSDDATEAMALRFVKEDVRRRPQAGLVS